MKTDPESLHWRPPPDTRRTTRLGRFIDRHGFEDYEALLAQSNRDPAWFWQAVMDEFAIRMPVPFDTLLDVAGGPQWARWCVGGRTNIAMHCLEADHPPDGEALVWESESGRVRSWSRQQLRRESARLAHGLRSLGLGRGDVIALYLPMLPETAAAFMAVAAIGGIVLPLFSGFGAEAIVSRMRDAGAVAIITVDGTRRRGESIAMKTVVDNVADRLETLRHVIVFANTGQSMPFDPRRDLRWEQLLDPAAQEPEYEWVDADSPFMLIYTSGTTGAAKGTVHSHCGFLCKLAADFGLNLDLRAGDRMFWMSDMGWVVGPMMLVAGTFLGATVVMAEGVPDWPGVDRLWDLCERHRVSYFGLAPTIARTLMRHGDQPVRKHDLSALRRVVSSGESWNPDSWAWFIDTVCGRRVPILNVSGGTEIGWGIVGSTPLHPLKPCQFSAPCLAMGADVVDADGRSVAAGEVGELALRIPSIGLSRGLWNDPERYLDTYWRRIPGLWVHGDWASRDSDGYWSIHGRSDDTIKLAGKRTGPAEIEAVVAATGLVDEVAACGISDPLKGEAVALVYVATGQPRISRGSEPGDRGPRPARPDPDTVSVATPDLAMALAEAVSGAMGRAFRPAICLAVGELPKTRSQKVMRRVIKAILEGRDPGDLAALANPQALTELSRAARSR